MTDSLHIRGEQTVLRDFQPGDQDDVARIVGDDRVTRWLSFDSRTPGEARAMLDGIMTRAQLVPRTEYHLAVTLPEQPEAVIGFARLGLAGVRAGKLGYAIDADHTNHGHAIDAAAALTTYGFELLALHRISAAIGPDNHVSIKVAQRLGMSYEGRIRDHVHTNGSWRDSLLYSLLEPEWRKHAVSISSRQDAPPSR